MVENLSAGFVGAFGIVLQTASDAACFAAVFQVLFALWSWLVTQAGHCVFL